MIPGGWRTAHLLLPVAAPVPPLQIHVAHRVSNLYSHLPGVARGSLIYTDLAGRGWYRGYSMVTQNRGHKGLRRTHRGVEDGVGTNTD